MWTGKHTAILGVACVTSLAAGSASGWFLAKRQLTEEFDQSLQKELEETKRFYANLNKPDPETLAQMLLDEKEVFEEGQSKHQYDTTSDEVPPEVLERIVTKMREAEAEVEAEAAPMVPDGPHNAFENPAPAWVQEDEEMERRNGEPYIISHEEYYENQWEFEQGQVTFYEGDSVLADSRDEPIGNAEAFVGEKAISGDWWGHGAHDSNVVHVCNEQLETVFEICRSNKSFAEDVLGFQNGGTLQHGMSRTKRQKPEWDG